MKFRYTKFTGDLLDEIDLEDLVSKLSDLLMASGFNNPWGDPSDSDEDRTMQALHDAILEACSAMACSRTRRCSNCSASRPTAIRKAPVTSWKN